MLIYVEGPAGAGKTSFMRELQRQCPDDYLYLEEYILDEDPNTNKDYQTFVANSEAKMAVIGQLEDGAKAVVDRGHLSLMVNAAVEQAHGLNNSYEEALQWYKHQESLETLVLPDLYVFIAADTDLILKRAKDNGWYRENLGWTKDPALAIETYRLLFAELESGVAVLELDGAKDSKNLVEEFQAHILKM